MAISYENTARYKELIEKIKQKKCVLFLGSGLSVAAGYPDWHGLMEKMIEQMHESISAEDLEELNALLQKHDYLQIASHFKALVNPQEYTDFLTKIFSADHIRPTENHLQIVRLHFPCIITTNYDKLVESAYYEINHVMPRIRHHQSDDLGSLLSSDNFFIFKSHGVIDDIGSIILTRQDYNRLIYDNQAYRTFIEALLVSRNLLFVGFSLNDPDFNLFSDYLSHIYQGHLPRSYALLTGVSRLRMNSLEHERNIKIIFYENKAGDHREVGEFFELLSRGVSEAPGKSTMKPAKIPFKFLEPYYQTDEKYFWGRANDEKTEHVYKTIGDENAKLIVLYGQKGAGKTSLINALLIPRLKRDGFFIEYFSYHDIPGFMENITAKEFAKLIKTKKAVLFFDHFDRLIDECEKSNTSPDLQTWIMSFVEKLEKDQHLVFIIQEDQAANLWKLFQTLREQHPEMPENKIIEIIPLDQDQKSEFIEKASESVNIEFHKNLLEKLIQDEKDLTYLQAQCYYITKNGLQETPDGLEKMNISDILKMLIRDADIMSKLKELNSPDMRRVIRAIFEVLIEKKEDDFIKLLYEMSPRLRNFGIMFPYENE
ncbi:SIR2 family protein [candidate division KSB1 bacterium]|nr:SIR2 family protein [candidate division KSB1 bacterium]